MDDEFVILSRTELENLVKVLIPMSFCWGGGSYNKWMHTGPKKGKMPLVDAATELRKILPQLQKMLDEATAPPSE